MVTMKFYKVLLKYMGLVYDKIYYYYSEDY